jgi:hypothetical protein
MFESNTIFDGAIPYVPGQNSDAAASGSGTALRAFGWEELAARINAAHDLRRVLRQDREQGSASFGDAAAGYFNSQSNDERSVNHGDLEHRKSCWRKATAVEEAAALGDEEI